VWGILDGDPVPESELEEGITNILVCEVPGNAVSPDPVEVGRLPLLPDEDRTTIEAGAP
jgi:hypothetical protein